MNHLSIVAQNRSNDRTHKSLLAQKSHFVHQFFSFRQIRDGGGAELKVKYPKYYKYSNASCTFGVYNQVVRVNQFRNIFLVSSVSSKKRKKTGRSEVSHSSTVEFICSFFGRNVCLKKSF